MRGKRKTIRHLKVFFHEMERQRRRRLWKATARTQRMKLSPVVLEAITAQLPAVIRTTKAAWIDNVREQVISEFIQLAAAAGRTLQRPGYNDSQYVFWLLCKSANRVTGSYRMTRQFQADAGQWASIAANSPGTESGPNVDAPRPDPLQTVEQVRVALKELSERVQRTASCVWLEGVPIAEVAQLEGASENAIELRLHRARRHLSRRLNIPIRLRAKHKPRPRNRIKRK